MRLTREQQRAVRSRAHALEIRAGAGTGKTATLCARIVRQLAEGTPEPRILAVTFTREATASLHRRLGALLGRRHAVRVASFHQWAARELAGDGLAFLPEGEARALVLRSMRRGPAAALAAAWAGPAADAASRVLALLGYVRNAETSVPEAIERQFPHFARWSEALAQIEEEYEAGKGGRLDFDDLLLRFRDALRRPSFCARVAGRLDHLAVDEYQDVSRAQDEAVRRVAREVPVTIVGDPRQGIYGFRGASPAFQETFLASFPAARTERVPLTRSFRATRSLVAAGNAVLPDAHPLRAPARARRGAAPRFAGFDDTVAEARAVVEHLNALAPTPGESVVLCRSRPLASAFLDERHGAAADVPVATIHAAKGLEWDHVVLLGAREGGLPGEPALRAPGAAGEPLLAEERRLLYVAVTRAKKTLLVTWARTPSRFLAGLAPEAHAMPTRAGSRPARA